MASRRALRHPTSFVPSGVRARMAGSAVAAALVLAVASPALVLAAAPARATVVVSVVDDETHDPVAGADVALTGSVDTAVDPVYTADRPTGADGKATFVGVPLTAGGEAVRVSADVSLAETTPYDGCTLTRTWTGGSDPTTVEPVTAIEVRASRKDEISCPDPGPGAPVLSGLVVGTDGSPAKIEFGSITMDREDGAHWSAPVAVDATGAFSIAVQPWGTPDAPAHLLLRLTGPVTGTETEGDCTYQVAVQATFERDVELANGGTLERVGLVAQPTRVGGVCSTTGTPSPTGTARPTVRPSSSPATGSGGAAGTPAPTLPPTDALTPGRPDRAVAAALVGMLLGLAAVFGWAVLGRRTGRP